MMRIFSCLSSRDEEDCCWVSGGEGIGSAEEMVVMYSTILVLLDVRKSWTERI